MQLMVNNKMAFRNAVSVFYQFSMRYCGFLPIFFAVLRFWLPPNVLLVFAVIGKAFIFATFLGIYVFTVELYPTTIR